MKKVVLKSTILTALIIAMLFLSGCSGANEAKKTELEKTAGANDKILIGISFADLQGRWQIERDAFTEKANELGASVIIASADMDADKQTLQAKNLIMQGVDILMVVPQDGEKAGEIVNEAHKAGIKVIVYDRMIKNSSPDFFLGFDNALIGEYQAKGILNVVDKGNFAYIGGSPTDNNAFLYKDGSFKVLQPKIDSGDIKIVLNELIDSWRPVTAYETLSAHLNKSTALDAVVVANDGLAAGVIQALEEHGLAGKVAVSGQDATLNAIKHIVDGKQTLTIYKPLKGLAIEAAIVAVDMSKGKTVSSSMSISNGVVDVPSRLLDVVIVTKDNINDTVIKDNFYTYEEVYGNKTTTP